MSRTLNRVTLIGNLGADPESRVLPSGSTVTNLSLATSEQWTDQASGQPRERTEWHRLVAFDKRAETLARFAHKGSRLYVEGQLQYRSYEDAAGITRYITEVRVRDFQLMDPPPAQDSASPKQRQRVAAVAGARTLDRALVEDDLPF
jgi:single-strand DNA-binding protein